MKVRIEFHSDRIIAASRRGALKTLRRTGAYVRKVAQNKVSKSAGASTPGAPPHTRRGQLKKSILFGVDDRALTVVIGPAFSLIGTSMTAHEFGGKYKKQTYPERPLMGPTLEESAPKMPKLWEDSL